MPRRLSRSTYTGALLLNAVTFALPALYDTLVKIWISKIDSSFVVTTDSYTYINTIVEVLNEGLPRAAYLVIGNLTLPLPRRLNLVGTLLTFQIVAGLVLSIVFVGCAPNLAAAFVPIEVREASIGYVRISSWSALTSAASTAISLATRSLDRPDVPLVISLCQTAANIILDFIFLSTFRVHTSKPPTVNTQASIRMACNGLGCLAGLVYFVYVVGRLRKHHRLDEIWKTIWLPTWGSFIALAKPGLHTAVESAVRNALYLWLIHGIVALGSDYATAFSSFNTIRWGLVMVPVNALSATSSTFVGHEWGLWRERALTQGFNQASLKDLLGPFKIIPLHQSTGIFRPALRSTFIALLIEVPLCLAFSFALAKPFARYLSDSDTVAAITTKMWRTIDWCYIMYGTDTQLAAILLATRPKWYLMNSLAVNIGWVFPWCVALQVGIPITESSAWTYHSIVFGGSLVASFIVTIGAVILWALWLLQGKVKKL
ncbi:MATE efflux family protein [Ceratobasidium sp. AG-Ba]|nr:MATE efflux family protein [Ceratobasidium sp. AG-Ba]